MIEILDTTLRDGEQAAGIEFSEHDKIAAAEALSKLGVTFIEAGNPYASALDARVLNAIGANPKICAFGSTRRKDTKPDADAGLAALSECGAKTVVIFGKAWKLQVDKVLKTTYAENLAMISESVAFLLSKGKDVIFDAEHFFDGFRTDEDYAVAALEAAFRAGAKRLVLCDTDGGAMPEEIFNAVMRVKQAFPSAVIGIHTHNDCSLAESGAIAAVKAGATHVQGTLLGFGERCGNANLSALIPVLQLKMGYEILPADKLASLTQAADAVAECANITVPPSAPFVGANAFSHKAGMHGDGVLKCPESFEHIAPESVGNGRKLVLSGLAGKNMVYEKLKACYPELKPDDPRVETVFRTVKENFSVGYSYEGADGSFYVIAKRVTEGYEPFFKVSNYKVITEQPHEGLDVATAVIKVKVGEKTKMASAEGSGPVHALDVALRQALSGFYPIIGKLTLSDYKVRVINSDKATAAKVRVAITTTDEAESFTTVGVSTDIIQASFFALSDAIDYELLKSGVANEN